MQQAPVGTRVFRAYRRYAGWMLSRFVHQRHGLALADISALARVEHQ